MSIGTTAELFTKFRATFTELASVTDEKVTRFLEEARLIHAIRETATLYCAAHLVVLDRDEGAYTVDGGAGLVEGETVGPGMTTFKSQAKDEQETFFARSSYGRMFLTLERRTPEKIMSMRVYG